MSLSAKSVSQYVTGSVHQSLTVVAGSLGYRIVDSFIVRDVIDSMKPDRMDVLRFVLVPMNVPDASVISDC